MQIETSKLLAQTNKEKARLAILLMSHRAFLKKSPTKRKNLKKLSKVECINSHLMDKLKEHFNKDIQAGECTIVSKMEQQSIDIESLQKEMSSINLNSKCIFDKNVSVGKMMMEYNMLSKKVQ